MRSSARATFKNLNFRSLCGLEKTWEYNLKPKSQSIPKSQSFESLNEYVAGMSLFKLQCLK